MLTVQLRCFRKITGIFLRLIAPGDCRRSFLKDCVVREAKLFRATDIHDSDDMANTIQVKVNGVAHSFDGDPDAALLW